MAYNRTESYIDKAVSISSDAEFSDITSVRRHRADYMVVLYMGLLMLLGLIVMYAIGPQRANVLNNAYGSDYSSSYFFLKQLASVGLALIVFGIMSTIPYTLITKHSGKLLTIGVGACLLLAIADALNMSIAQQSLGATRWFNLGGLGTLQPSEILKFAMLIFTAGFLGNRMKQGRVNDVKNTLIPLGFIVGISLLFIVVLQRDLGTGVSLMGIVSAALFASGLNRKNSVRILLLALALGCVFIFSAEHRVERVMTFLQGDSASDTTGDSWQVEHAKQAIGTGGLFGVGIGNSVQATGYLPEATNDSVFAIIGEMFGFVGLMVVLAIFTALLLRLLKLMDHLVDTRLKLLVAGVFGWFGSHVVLNIASMTGVFPLTGITLPLLSFGGTSMVFIAAALGLVLQLSRYTVHASLLKEVRYEDSSRRRGIGRTRYASRGGSARY